MFTINNIYLDFPFPKKNWWKPEYAQFDSENLLRMLPLLQNSVLSHKKNEKNEIYLKEYSDYYKKMYLTEILNGENNVTKADLDYYNQQKISLLSPRNLKKILNLKSAVNFLFPDIFVPVFSADRFTENLAIDLNRIIGKDLFEQNEKYRINEAMASQINYRYLESNKIQDEMKKLFDFTREKFIKFIILQEPAEPLIKLGSQFLSHFLAIHPFYNGNGRVARLLLSYLLSSITVIPVSIYSKTENSRDIYLKCLIEDRTKSSATESSLASLVLESAYISLENVCISLDIFPSIDKSIDE
jgi:Fic family protein